MLDAEFWKGLINDGISLIIFIVIATAIIVSPLITKKYITKKRWHPDDKGRKARKNENNYFREKEKNIHR